MRGRIFFAIAVITLILIVPIIYWVLFERGFAVANREVALPRAPSGLTVTLASSPFRIPVALSVEKFTGQVEINRGDGTLRPAEEGMVLLADDRIRTRSQSRVSLSMPGVFAVHLLPDSDFKVGTLTENVFRFLLEQGMLSAEVAERPDHLFEITARTSTATTRGGKFEMNVTEKGLVSVAATDGSVDLAAGGRVVQVRSGTLARVEPGGSPSDPIKIPKQLFLRVRWPDQRDLAQPQLLVTGRTERNARLEVDGDTVNVDARGRFRQVVMLKEGQNRIVVEAYEVGGLRIREQSPPLNVDTRSDEFQIQTSPDLWKKYPQKAPTREAPLDGRPSSPLH